jgi:kumamolisin
MDLLAAYNWPTNLAGGGKIGILECGGGFVQSDLDAFCSANGLPPITPTWTNVDGQTPNAPGGDADDEVALDIEVAYASYFYATGGKIPTIEIFGAANIAEALIEAGDSGCAVFSMSWGAAESVWGKAAVKQMDAAAVAALAKGCIPLGAAGDNDADDSTGVPAVDCPASCPHIIGCGGTHKPPTGAESVWDDSPAGQPNGEGTGGGFSKVFPVQAFQKGAPKPPKAGLGALVPDISADADPDTGYEIVVGGQTQVVGGTSAVAPLYAGLFAALGPLGANAANVLPTLWDNHGCFNDITVGGNGLYKALKGPDPCTGIGSPNGAKIAALF